MLDIRNIALTETEKQKIGVAFNTYLISIKNADGTFPFTEEPSTAWLTNLEKYFLNRKILFCMGINNAHAEWEIFSNELASINNIVLNVRPASILMHELEQQTIYFEASKTTVIEKIEEEKKKKQALIEKQAHIDANNDNTPTELGKAEPIIYAEVKIKYYQQFVTLIEDYQSYLQSLQLYLIERFSLNKPAELNNRVFSDSYFLANNASSDVSISSELPADAMSKTGVKFFSAASNDARNKLITLQKAYKELKIPSDEITKSNNLVLKNVKEFEAMSSAFDYKQRFFADIRKAEEGYIKDLADELDEESKEDLRVRLNKANEPTAEQARTELKSQQAVRQEIKERITNTLGKIQEYLGLSLHKPQLQEFFNDVSSLKIHVEEKDTLKQLLDEKSFNNDELNEKLIWENNETSNIEHPAVEIRNFLFRHIQVLEAVMDQPFDAGSSIEEYQQAVYKKIYQCLLWFTVAETLIKKYREFIEAGEKDTPHEKILQIISTKKENVKTFVQEIAESPVQVTDESRIELITKLTTKIPEILDGDLLKDLEDYHKSQENKVKSLRNNKTISILNDLSIKTKSIQSQLDAAWSAANPAPFAFDTVFSFLNEVISSAEELIRNNGINDDFSTPIAELQPFVRELKSIINTVTKGSFLQNDVLELQEAKTIWENFYHYAMSDTGPVQAQNKIEWNQEEVRTWYEERYKTHFARLKIKAQQAGRNFSLDEAFKEYNTDLIWFLRPGKDIMQEFSTQQAYLQSFRMQIEEEVNELNENNGILQQEIKKIILTDTERQTKARSLEGRADIRRRDYEITKYTHQLNDAEAKKGVFTSVANEIQDLQTILTALQAYLAETQYIEDIQAPDGVGIFSETKFRDKFVSKDNQLFSRPHLLQKALTDYKKIVQDISFLTDLSVASKYQLKYNTLAAIYKLEKPQDKPDVFADKNAATHQLLSHHKLVLAKVNYQLKPHANYIVELLNSAKIKLIPVWQKKLATLQEKLTKVKVLEQEIINTLEGEQKIEAMQNATLPGKIADLEKHIQKLTQLEPEKLDQNLLTLEDVTLCNFVLETMTNTEENIARYNGIVEAHKQKDKSANGIDVRVLQRKPGQEDDTTENRKPLILRNFDGASDNLIGYFAENNRAVLAYLGYLQKRENETKVDQTLAYYGAWKTYWKATNALPENMSKLQDSASKVDRDHAEIEKIINRGDERPQLDEIEQRLPLEQRQNRIKVRETAIVNGTFDLLKRVSNKINYVMLQIQFDQITQRSSLERLSMEILSRKEWRENLAFSPAIGQAPIGLGIENPVFEMLSMLLRHINNKPAQETVQNQENWLKQTLIWLRAYKNFHYDLNSKIKSDEFLRRTEKFIKQNNKQTVRNAPQENTSYTPITPFDLFVGDLNNFCRTEMQNSLPAKENQKQEDFKEIQQFLINLAFAFPASSSNSIAWADKHVNCPYYALFKLKSELTRIIKLVKKYDQTSVFVQELEGKYLTEIEISIKEIQRLYNWDQKKIDALNVTYGDKMPKIETEVVQPLTVTGLFDTVFNTLSLFSRNIVSQQAPVARASSMELAPVPASAAASRGASSYSASGSVMSGASSDASAADSIAASNYSASTLVPAQADVTVPGNEGLELDETLEGPRESLGSRPRTPA